MPADTQDGASAPASKKRTEVKVAAIAAAAALFGGAVTSLADAVWIDAGTNREADLELLKLSIGILSEPLASDRGEQVSQQALRTWAVQTINAVAEVELNTDAANALIDGETYFQMRALREQSEASREAMQRMIDLMEP